MSDPDRLHIDDTLSIPMRELEFRYSRSSGPGGQHVNRTATRVELLWDVQRSPSLSEFQRRRILKALAGRIDKEGVLHLTSGERRSQRQNKEAVLRRLVELVRDALQPQKKRIPTRPTPQAKERRLREKRLRSQRKKWRGKVDWE